MRILHVLDHSIPLQSGYSFRTLSILTHQRNLGWETFQLTGPKQGACGALEETADGWEFSRTLAEPGWRAMLPGLREIELMARTETRLEAVARRVKPDVIHAHSPVLNAIPALRVGRRLGLPVVYEVRAFWEDAAVDHGTATPNGIRYRMSRWLETYALRRVDAITTICEGLRDEISARRIPSRKITVIPNAVDAGDFRIPETPDAALRQSLGLEGRVVIGFVGSFYSYEGLDLLIEALPQILCVAPDARVLLVGGGPQEETLRQQAQALGLTDKVVFAGRVAHGNVAEYYALIDLLAYPRRSMRLTELVTPLKPLEAMVQGKSLVASDVGGHRELIRNGETGILFRAGDRDDLACKVVEALTGRANRAGMVAAALRYARDERTWAASVGRYRGVYEAALRRD